MIFSDRTEAGVILGEKLIHLKRKNLIVYALPRGGVIVGAEVAKKLHKPLGLIISRKIGHPYNPEYAIAAVGESGKVVGNENEIASVDKDWFKQAVDKEKEEIQRRRILYLANKKETNIKGKIAVIVDDGIATGLTMKAAIQDVKDKFPERIIVAVPVAPREVIYEIKNLVDEVIVLNDSEEYVGSVGEYYVNFPQINDNEVIDALHSVMQNVLLFAFPLYNYLAEGVMLLKGVIMSSYSINRYANGELYIKVEEGVRRTLCIILGTLAPPEENFMALFALAHTLKKEGAKKVTALIPYLSYTRHERDKPGESLLTKWVGNICKASGIDEVVTFDVHSKQDKLVFPVPLISISTADLFAEEIRRQNLFGYTPVAPDEGALPRCQNVTLSAGLRIPIAYCVKMRLGESVSSHLHGEVGDKALVIDDVLDTGATLIAACRNLNEAGVKEIVIMVTHGLFTGSSWIQLWDLGVKQIYCTDTCPSVFEINDKRVTVISVLPLLSHYIEKKMLK